MKYLKIIAWATAIFLLLASSYTLMTNDPDLPQAAYDYVADAYPEHTISGYSWDEANEEFEVDLNVALVLYFDEEGAFLREIDSESNDVDLPTAAVDYITEYYPESEISYYKWVATEAHFEVELSTGETLHFDSEGNVISDRSNK